MLVDREILKTLFIMVFCFAIINNFIRGYEKRAEQKLEMQRELLVEYKKIEFAETAERREAYKLLAAQLGM